MYTFHGQFGGMMTRCLSPDFSTEVVLSVSSVYTVSAYHYDSQVQRVDGNGALQWPTPRSEYAVCALEWSLEHARVWHTYTLCNATQSCGILRMLPFTRSTLCMLLELNHVQFIHLVSAPPAAVEAERRWFWHQNLVGMEALYSSVAPM